MLSMIIKMSAITVLYILVTAAIWHWTRKKELTVWHKLLIGLIYGGAAVLSTHYGISFEGMIINLRDLGPLIAGFFFSPMAGVLAGLIGGIERYIAGTYFGVGEFTRIACSISTCLAGFVTLITNKTVFKGKKPSPHYSFLLGSTMEVFHMYVVFITHRDDMRMAFNVVKTCSGPMIIFSGIGLALVSILIQVMSGEWENPFSKVTKEQVPVSKTFQYWLFIVTSIVIISSFIFSYLIQSQSAFQNKTDELTQAATQVKNQYMKGQPVSVSNSQIRYNIYSSDGTFIEGSDIGPKLGEDVVNGFREHLNDSYMGTYLGVESLIYVTEVYNYYTLVTAMDAEEVYWNRNAQAYEMALADILLFTVIYILIAYLVNQIVVINIQLINDSLGKITEGDLNEVVDVRSSSEFTSLSDDINQTVVTLKGYIAAAEKRIEEELSLAASIQESALPKVFAFPDRNEFHLYASMNPAKEVGGDFYDFFFVDNDRLALVIADVSGKGIPAAMFMMRSKTTIRSLAETGASPSQIMYRANNMLCDGNDADMFVTVWIGVIDLNTGIMKCSNAGHEYPVIMRAGGDYEVLEDKHTLALAALPDAPSQEYEIEMKPGDRLFVYTDGVPEAAAKDDEQYGLQRLTEALNETKTYDVGKTLNIVAKSVDDFCNGAEQFDDITMLGFEYLGKPT